MIWFKKAQKIDLLTIIDYKLYTILPFVKDKEEKLKIIVYVNKLMLENYNKVKLIYHNFKRVGAYLIKDNELDLLYIINDYQNKKIGSKVLKKLKGKFKNIKVRNKNTKALKFYQKNGYKIILKNKDYYILGGKENGD